MRSLDEVYREGLTATTRYSLINTGLYAGQPREKGVDLAAIKHKFVHASNPKLLSRRRTHAKHQRRKLKARPTHLHTTDIVDLRTACLREFLIFIISLMGMLECFFVVILHCGGFPRGCVHHVNRSAIFMCVLEVFYGTRTYFSFAFGSIARSACCMVFSQ